MVAMRKIPDKYTAEKWQVIEAYGAKAGANSEQMRKWRSRGVSAFWQSKLIVLSRGKIKASDFVETETA